MTMKLLVLFLLMATGGDTPSKDTEMGSPNRRTTDLPPPRDPDIAVQEELDLARRAGTVAAYDLFMARHPGHPLVETARRERDRIAKGNRN